MSQSSFKTLAKNVKNLVPAAIALATQGSQAFGTWRKIYDRGQKYGPEDYVDQAEVYCGGYDKRQMCQRKNVWIDTKLSEEVSQKELAQLISYKVDFWRTCHTGWATFFLGGYALPIWIFWLGNDTHIPSQFNANKEELAAWREAQDLYRYKHAPNLVSYFKYILDYSGPSVQPDQEKGWLGIQEKNNVHRDPKACRVAAEILDRDDRFIMNNWWRRQNAYHARPMNIPTFPLMSRSCMAVRIRDYWNLIWNEDFMTIKGSLLDGMTDEEVYDFAWRRFLSPYDLKLTREQNIQRINDYFTFLGQDFIDHQKTPNLNALAMWCFGHYNEPAFLVDDISDLDANDYDNLKSWSADVFLRRLEFENGPLRDQVEAHSQKLIESRNKAAAEQVAK
jgi:hypothetical protein